MIFFSHLSRSLGRRCVAPVALFAATVLGAGSGGEARAQAFCELRDPVRQIYELLPEATAHRSVVRSVNAASREATAGALPFTLHFNELGRHTLYVGMNGATPFGLVHVRSEAGRWGLVEIAWALDLDLRIRDFAFQRCRDAARRAVEADAIADQIRGRSFAELRAMLSADGSSLSGQGLGLPPGSGPEVEALVVTTLRSALKTQVVTHTAWNGDLQTIRWIARGHAAFGGDVGVERVDHPWASPTLVAVLDHGVGSASAIDREQSVVLRVREAQGGVRGLLVHTPWTMEGVRSRIWWTVDPEGRIAKVEVLGGNREVAAAFAALEGHGMDRFHRCSTAVELAGKEVVLLARYHSGAGLVSTAAVETGP